jgi:hypothetical protein
MGDDDSWKDIGESLSEAAEPFLTATLGEYSFWQLLQESMYGTLKNFDSPPQTNNIVNRGKVIKKRLNLLPNIITGSIYSGVARIFNI